MKKALLSFWREAVPVLKYMAVVTFLIVLVAGCSVSSAFAKWAGISIGSLIVLGMTFFILLSVLSHREAHKDDTPAQKAKSRQGTNSLLRFLFQASLFIVSCIVGGLIILAIPIGAFMLLFPTYGAMVAALGVITVIIALICVFFIAKGGRDLTNTFFFWPFN